MNAANWITVGRIVLVPIFLVCAYMRSDAGAIAALVVFVIASVSDRLDGQLARRRQMVSRLGEFLDPSADKLLIGAALWALVDLHDFPLWAALLIAGREVAVQILRTRIVSTGGTLPSSVTGKVKTVLQVVMVSWWLLPVEPNPSHWVLLVVGVGITLWSGLDYFRQGMRRPTAKVST